jgi:hypothetical protein
VRKKWLLVALALTAGLAVALLLGLNLTWSFGRPHRVNADNFGRIEPGMTRAEVSALLGETKEPLVPLGDGRHRAYYAENAGASLGRGAIIALVLDSDGRVADKAFEEEDFTAWCERMGRAIFPRR